MLQGNSTFLPNDLANDILALGSRLHGLGRLDCARALYDELLKQPSPEADVYNLYGFLSLQQGFPADALTYVSHAIALRGSDTNFHNHLGLALQALGQPRWPEAADAYLAAIRLSPTNGQALDNLLALLGNLESPSDKLQQLLPLLPQSPDMAGRWLQVARLFQACHNYEGSREAFTVTRMLAPEDLGVIGEEAMLCRAWKKIDDAADLYRRMIEIDSTNDDAREQLAGCLIEMGDHGAGVTLLEEVVARHPTPINLAKPDLAVPTIPQSVEDIARFRERLAARMDRILEAPQDYPGLFPDGFFYLAYHGLPNGDLMTARAKVAQKTMPWLNVRSRHVDRWRGPKGRIRVGFVSTFYYAHSVNRTSRGMIEFFDRSRFEVVLVCLPPRRTDWMGDITRSQADSVVELSGDLTTDQLTLAELGLDVLFYQDIGMNPYAGLLAHARLAPLQCTFFGHPDTTGIPTLDDWISIDVFEPEGAEAHYTERLEILRNIPQFSYYYRLGEPAPMSRADFGLGATERLLLCPQFLFKVHPDFDAIVAEILARDSKVRILFTRSPVDNWSAAILKRMAPALGRNSERITQLPHLSMPQLMGVETFCDGILDTVHFNGYNTSLEALHIGAPIVTLPKLMQRGRHTAGMYSFMEMDDLVARDEEDYIAKAIELAANQDYREAMHERILERSHVLFENLSVIRAYEDYFERRVAEIAATGNIGAGFDFAAIE